MRAFIVLGHRVPLTPNFTLNDLPGSAGRLDILCRCVTAAFCLSHGIRRDVIVYLVLQNQIIVRLEGSQLRHLNPDERSTAALLQRALKAFADSTHKDRELESSPGIFIAPGGLSDALKSVQGLGLRVYWLYEQGSPIRHAQLHKDGAFVLSDHLEFLPEEAALLEGFPKLSLGPLSLHADHCIVIVHNELDVRFAFPPASQ